MRGRCSRVVPLSAARDRLEVNAELAIGGLPDADPVAFPREYATWRSARRRYLVIVGWPLPRSREVRRGARGVHVAIDPGRSRGRPRRKASTGPARIGHQVPRRVAASRLRDRTSRRAPQPRNRSLRWRLRPGGSRRGHGYLGMGNTLDARRTGNWPSYATRLVRSRSHCDHRRRIPWFPIGHTSFAGSTTKPLPAISVGPGMAGKGRRQVRGAYV